AADAVAAAAAAAKYSDRWWKVYYAARAAARKAIDEGVIAEKIEPTRQSVLQSLFDLLDRLLDPEQEAAAA
nr:hypothetical protein [Actinomycetota bacterium]